MNPINLVLLEGEVVFASEIKLQGDKKYQDLFICTHRRHQNGIGHYKYSAVASDNVLDSFGTFKVGEYVRIRGHLQSSIYHLDNGTDFDYQKVRIDFAER
jgi:hypothetical protein